MKPSWIVLCLWTAFAVIAARPTPAEDAPSPVRIGTFDREKVLIAYYGSQQFDQIMQALMKEHAAAQAAGEKKRVKELEKRGEALQEMAHHQMEGKESLQPIFDALGPALADAAREAGVSAITAEVYYAGESAQRVDVTEALIRRLPRRVR